MGYRSTFITTDTFIKLPDWFVEKYKNNCNIDTKVDYLGGYNEPYSTCPVSSKVEGKMYGMYSEVMEDLHKCVVETQCTYSLYVVVLHEDGAVDKYTITDVGVVKEVLVAYGNG